MFTLCPYHQEGRNEGRSNFDVGITSVPFILWFSGSTWFFGKYADLITRCFMKEYAHRSKHFDLLPITYESFHLFVLSKFTPPHVTNTRVSKLLNSRSFFFFLLEI